MAKVETNILDIDIQGEGKKVLTDYQPHTISIVGEGALGMNLTKVKSEKPFLETEGGAELMSKVNKAKALDAEQAEVEAVVAEDVAQDEPVEAVEAIEPETEAVEPVAEEVPAEDVVEPVKATEEVVEPEAEQEAEVEAEIEEPAEVAEPEVQPEPEVEPEPVAAVEPEAEIEVEAEGAEANKAKAYTADELIQAQKDALDGVNTLVKKIQSAIPDANLWQVTDLVYSALWKVEDAVHDAKDALWDEIYQEVYTEVNTRVNKAKALKIAEEGTPEQKLKAALALVDPSIAELIQAEVETNKAKALEAETERKAVIRAKALETGATKFKRIATDENTTDMITDAMIQIEQIAPEQHAVIAKALSTASLITQAGELFPDVGSASSLQIMDEHEYVETKAKALVDIEGGNLAAARATIRQTEDYRVNYG